MACGSTNKATAKLNSQRLTLSASITYTASFKKAISNALSQQPLYKLQDDNVEHQLAKSMLESVTIENGELLVTLKGL
ncbi:MAG: hypothetical protein ACJAYG_000902 [Oceanicoccus sp.]|jgi:hypothetical protein